MPPMNPVQLVQAALARNRRVMRSPFGRSVAYGQGDPNSFPRENSYSEKMVFNGAAIDLVGNLAGSGVIASAIGAPIGYQQNDHFTVQALPADGLVLPYNPKRIALTLQNQDAAADLFYSLGTEVGSSGGGLVGVKLVAGQGYTFDNGCVPSDALYISWSTGFGVGVVMEGTRA